MNTIEKLMTAKKMASVCHQISTRMNHLHITIKRDLSISKNLIKREEVQIKEGVFFSSD